jgi:hypothetical protein
VTEVWLRSYYLMFRVSEGDIPSNAIRELMSVLSSSHALAVAFACIHRDHHISLTTIDVLGNDQQGDFSGLTFASGGSPPEVNNHPGNPALDGVAAAGDQVGFPRSDVAEDNADENTITRVNHMSSHKGRPFTPPRMLPRCRQELVMTMQAVAWYWRLRNSSTSRSQAKVEYRSYPPVIRVKGSRERRGRLVKSTYPTVIQVKGASIRRRKPSRTRSSLDLNWG